MVDVDYDDDHDIYSSTMANDHTLSKTKTITKSPSELLPSLSSVAEIGDDDDDNGDDDDCVEIPSADDEAAGASEVVELSVVIGDDDDDGGGEVDDDDGDFDTGMMDWMDLTTSRIQRKARESP